MISDDEFDPGSPDADIHSYIYHSCLSDCDHTLSGLYRLVYLWNQSLFSFYSISIQSTGYLWIFVTFDKRGFSRWAEVEPDVRRPT